MKFFSIVSSFFLAIPFYYLWNYFAPIYLPNVPEIYKDIPFWHCVGVFVLIGIVKALVTPHSFFGWGHCKKW
jgi:hypothetical protein